MVHVDRLSVDEPDTNGFMHDMLVDYYKRRGTCGSTFLADVDYNIVLGKRRFMAARDAGIQYFRVVRYQRNG